MDRSALYDPNRTTNAPAQLLAQLTRPRSFIKMPPSLPHSPGRDARWRAEMRQRLAWLRDLGVMGKVHIDVLPDGLPGFYGMPEETFDHSAPWVSGPKLVRRALKDPRNHPLMGGPIIILREIEPDTHVAWRKALDRLEALCVPNTTATASDVSNILFEARRSYLTDWNQLIYFLAMGTKDCRYVLNQDEPVMPWLFQCMARMFGVQTPSEPDENWWVTAREQVELENNEKSFSLTDLAWLRLLEANRHFETGGFDEKAKIGAKQVVEFVDEFFELDKNRPICQLVHDCVFEDDP
ncbi:hypothetical protein BHE90_003780 [Fusarium euwallaceae]|uniref:Uncharacterized protein n=1 Tax=Fusarium euwallaceae TaxID=1147111 RepID=A0A430M171_9HYPO|nr:hypothetical protein BHE90_003780 [Fusarium euwallaceae]